MRVTVGMIVGAMAAGRTVEQLLADFPYIEEADILEALAFAAHLAQGHEVRLAIRSGPLVIGRRQPR
jgi:uncharacterized protein (DUF433 family)